MKKPLFDNFTFMNAVLIASCVFVASACSTAQKKSNSSAQTPASSSKNTGAVSTSSGSSSSASGGASLKSSASMEEGVVECKLKTDSRKIQVQKKGNGCEVIYTKFGKSSSVASSANGMDYCAKTQEKIKSKLTAASYQCQ